jgi:hypothetical protein
MMMILISSTLSLHFYTGFGARDRTQTEREFGRSVYGPAAAERAITVCEGLIEQAVSDTFAFLSSLVTPSLAVCRELVLFLLFTRLFMVVGAQSFNGMILRDLVCSSASVSPSATAGRELLQVIPASELQR